MVELDDLYSNITNNKTFLDIPECIDIKYDKKTDIFNDINLKSILNFKSIDLKKYNDDIPVNLKDNYKFIKNSFFIELSNLLFLDIRELKEEIANFINSTDGMQYLKDLSRFHKKLQREINNILLEENLDNFLNENLINIICKKYNINIILENENIYKKYKINSSEFYIFKIYKNEETLKNYKLEETLKEINDFLKDKIEYISDKELKKMNIDNIKTLSTKLKINKKLKTDMINDLILLFNKF